MTTYLLLSPHPDDVELGCIASVMQMAKKGDTVVYAALSDCTNIPRNANIIVENAEVCDILDNYFGKKEVQFHHFLFDYPNQRLREEHMKIRRELERLRGKFKPDVIFTTSPKDYHQDHSYIGEEALRVFRKSTVLFYEIPRGTFDFIPKYYVILDKKVVGLSIKILQTYKSQERKHYMRDDLMMGTYQHHGRMVNTDYAQAFEIAKVVVTCEH